MNIYALLTQLSVIMHQIMHVPQMIDHTKVCVACMNHMCVHPTHYKGLVHISYLSDRNIWLVYHKIQYQDQ